MNLNNHKLILGSKSPRRQMILSEAGIDFDVKVIDIEESYPGNMHAMDVAQYLAEKKAKQLPFLKPKEILMTADTTVVLNDTILGKPENRKEAFNMLSALSGRVHTVTTGVCIKTHNKVIAFDDTTFVYFKKLTDKEINFYIDNFEPYDKAGGYGIQDWIGMIGVIKIEGSFFNVMGLPIHKIYAELPAML